MLEQLIRDAILLSDEEKNRLLEKIQTASPQGRKNLERILSEEKELIISLFHEFSKRSKKWTLEMIRGRLQSFEIARIRQIEKEESNEDSLPELNF
jgi:DNA-binding PadR family transcriptional regulator